jgi:[protein-PII] uridylyltransferase
MYNAIQNFIAIELTKGDFEKYIPNFEKGRDDLKIKAKNYLDQCNTNLKGLHDLGYHSQQLLGVRTLMIDRLIQTLFKRIEKETIKKLTHQGPYASVIAQGGYGRGEMNLHSDIDLLFLYPKKKGAYIETVTEKLLYVLWDLKLDVGYATRTVNECKKLMHEDVTIMTSLLDVRFLAGDKNLFKDLKNGIDQVLSNKSNQDKFITQKVDERNDRIEKQGKSVFVLEPNVKESHGGLRDLQTLLWIIKLKKLGSDLTALKKNGFLKEDELKTLLTARNFLWRIRNELHIISGKKRDVLSFQNQETVATRMGFENDDKGILGVEKFMQTYYQLAYQISAITGTALRRMTQKVSLVSNLLQKLKVKNLDDTFRIVENRIAVKHQNLFKKDPINMMRIFKVVQEFGLGLDPETLDHIRFYTPKLVDDKFRSNSQAIYIFRNILNNYENLGLVLEAMHESHFLDEWMPEFKKLRCRVQHDIYHIYTIDTHSIYAVNELSKLHRGDYKGEFDFYQKVMNEVLKPEMLTLGLFLHDIGKGEGGNHEVKGAIISKSITERLGYSEEEKAIIDFLIQAHLMMPHLSQRRDLEDVELINKFSKSMGSLDRLNMLLLLTWGDIRAVGPNAWTDWKDALLRKLYQKAFEVITQGEFSKEKTIERMIKVKKSVLEMVRGRYAKEDVQAYLDIMPPRYFFANQDEEIQKHYELFEKTKKENIAVTLESENNLSKILIFTINKPRIFSEVAGVMRLLAINVVRADVFQAKNGQVLIDIWVTNEKGAALDDKKRFEEVKSTLEKVFSEENNLEELIEAKKVPDYLVKKPLQKAKEKVNIDNNISTYYTVIDVYAHDRLGLLYDLTKTLNDLGCYVDVSKISTKVEQVTDVFYVQDIFGHKIISKEKLREIKAKLLEIVKSGEE